MYKVQILANRTDCRKQSFDGVYIPPTPPPPVSEMMRRCAAYMRRRLEESDPGFRGCSIKVTLFRKIKTEFVCEDSG